MITIVNNDTIEYIYILYKIYLYPYNLKLGSTIDPMFFRRPCQAPHRLDATRSGGLDPGT